MSTDTRTADADADAWAVALNRHAPAEGDVNPLDVVRFIRHARVVGGVTVISHEVRKLLKVPDDVLVSADGTMTVAFDDRTGRFAPADLVHIPTRWEAKVHCLGLARSLADEPLLELVVHLTRPHPLGDHVIRAAVEKLRALLVPVDRASDRLDPSPVELLLAYLLMHRRQV